MMRDDVENMPYYCPVCKEVVQCTVKYMSPSDKRIYKIICIKGHVTQPDHR
jgi:hypothetical protein